MCYAQGDANADQTGPRDWVVRVEGREIVFGDFPTLAPTVSPSTASPSHAPTLPNVIQILPDGGTTVAAIKGDSKVLATAHLYVVNTADYDVDVCVDRASRTEDASKVPPAYGWVPDFNDETSGVKTHRGLETDLFGVPVPAGGFAKLEFGLNASTPGATPSTYEASYVARRCGVDASGLAFDDAASFNVTVSLATELDAAATAAAFSLDA